MLLYTVDYTPSGKFPFLVFSIMRFTTMMAF